MLCSIADVYDAMRSQRSYQQAFPTDRILEVLKRNDGTQFDQHLVRRFVQLVGIYPAGNLVRLDTGEVAVVVKVYAPDPHRPQVRVIVDRRVSASPCLRRQPVGKPVRRRTAQLSREGNRLRRGSASIRSCSYEIRNRNSLTSALESNTVRIATARAMSIAAMLALGVSHARGTGQRGGAAGQAGSAPSQPPRLVVLLIVDQMRADYVARFRSDWTRGLKRLLDQGAWFSRAAYPYLEYR